MVLKWIQNVLMGPRPELTGRAAAESDVVLNRPSRKAKLMDLANLAVRERATEYGSMVKGGFSSVTQRQMKDKIRKRVAKAIDIEFDDPELIEEITETITDAASIDPFYRKLVE